MNIVASDIRRMSPSATARIISGIVDNQQAIADGGIDTALRLCHFMAQLAHESAHFQVTREFASGAAYEGRTSLGNTQPGDGKRYRGRGLMQTTGRANYREATGDIKKMISSAPDFEDDPEALEEFPWALLAAVSYWRRKKINSAADRDDVEAVTRLVNGGLNGFAERKKYLAIAKAIWMSGGGASAGGAGGGTGAAASNPVLRVGANGDAVKKLQEALTAAGFSVAADGGFGEHTKSAVIAFQTKAGLMADGVVGEATWAALNAG